MDILDNNKILLFIIFVIPGFVGLKAYQLVFNITAKDTANQLIDAVAYSCINYAILLFPIYEFEVNDIRSSHPKVYISFYVFVLLLAPILWVLLLRYLRTTQAFQEVLPHPTQKPWDYVFGKRKPYWVIVTMKDGKRIGGRFDSLSFASSSPAIEQIYLEESWVLNNDGGFERQKTNTAGVLIMASDILTVEFFKLLYNTGETNVGQED